MQTERNTTTRKPIVSAKEARERSVTSKLAQLQDTIASEIETAINHGKRDHVTIHVAGYSEAVISKAIAELREQEYKVTVNRAAVNLSKNFASTLTVSWGE